MNYKSFQIEEFRRTESLVLDRSIDTMSVSDLTKLKNALIANTPTEPINPIMHRRWDRAYAEISSAIESKIANRRFRITIWLSCIIFIVGLLNLVVGFALRT